MIAIVVAWLVVADCSAELLAKTTVGIVAEQAKAIPSTMEQILLLFIWFVSPLLHSIIRRPALIVAFSVARLLSPYHPPPRVSFRVETGYCQQSRANVVNKA
jgi:hypothetical protein